MDGLRIRRLHNRCRLRGGHIPGRRERYERVLRSVLDEGLEAALSRVQVVGDEQVCVRRIGATVRLSEEDTDSTLALDWSLALANSIVTALREGGANVVRYHSQREALIDFAAGVARGDHSRAWAWRQLGLYPTLDAQSSDAAIEALVRALEHDGGAVVAVLLVLEEAGLLEDLSRRFSGQHWRALARAASAALGASAAYDAADVPETGPHMEAEQESALEERLTRILSRSLSARLLSSAGTRSCEFETMRALAILAVIAVEPALFSGADGERTRRVFSTTASLAARRAREAFVPDKIRHLEESGDRAEGDAAWRTPDRDAELTFRKAEPGGETPRLDNRHRGHTLWGGLLFLLCFVEECGLADEVLASDVLSTRSLSWTLHRIALVLLPMLPSDPAALAFAGLMPDGPPPGSEEPDPKELEEKAIAGHADRLASALRHRLREDEPDRGRLLQRVCARRAEIVADPGWIEVHLSLDEVSTTVRRHGLDLDPGYLTWLGVVVKFIYE